MIRILTDSASDITPAEAALLGVTIVPLNVTLEDGTVLRDGLDVTGDKYYSLLASCDKLPTTSQPSPELFAAEYAAAIAAALEQAKRHLHLVAVIDDLKYLRKGGRLPAAVAIAGGMLGIKPLITIKEGKVAMAGKARGLPGAYVALFKKVEELGGVNEALGYVTAYSAAPREVEPIRRYCTQNLSLKAPYVSRIGCVIGTHAGPGAFGIAFFDTLPDEAAEA